MLKVYSAELQVLAKRLSQLALKILSGEAKLKTYRKKFEYNGYLYPLHIHFFQVNEQNQSFEVGRFEAQFLTLSFWQEISQFNLEDCANLLRHELAHYLCYLKYGKSDQPHGKDFQSICRECGWGKEVSAATMQKPHIKNHSSARLQERYQKLLNLSESPNRSEAQQALKRAQEMALKYQLDSLEEDKELIYSSVLVQQKKTDHHWNSLQKIFSYFKLHAIIHKGLAVSCLEVIGEKEPVLTANLIYQYLTNAVERNWQEYKKENQCQGVVAKNSYYRGFYAGVIEGLEQQKQCFLSGPYQEALIISEKKLAQQVATFFPQLRSYATQYQSDEKCYQQGKKKGIKEKLNDLKQHYFLN